MSSGEITSELEHFIHDNIDSVEQLEVLVLLAADSHKEWSAEQISQKLYRQSDSVAERLEDLRRRGFLSASQSPQSTYLFNADGRNRTLVQALETAYKVRKDAVIRIIFSKPPDTLRAFSDAFRIRRDK